MNSTQVLIADDHHMVAESLKVLLEMIPGVEVCSIVNNGWQALSFVEKYPVDIVLADFFMPLLNGVDMAIRMKEKFPETKVMILTMSEDPAHIKDALIAGVDGYVMKKSGRSELEKAMKTVLAGEKYFGHDVVLTLSKMTDHNNANGKASLNDTKALTKREFEIVKLIIRECSNQEIAEKLFIHSTTVETHRRNIFRKLGVSSALGLMRWAMKHNFVEE